MVHIVIFSKFGERSEFDRDFPLGVPYTAERCKEAIDNDSRISGFFIYDDEGEYIAIVEKGIYFLQKLILC